MKIDGMEAEIESAGDNKYPASGKIMVLALGLTADFWEGIYETPEATEWNYCSIQRPVYYSVKRELEEFRVTIHGIISLMGAHEAFLKEIKNRTKRAEKCPLCGTEMCHEQYPDPNDPESKFGHYLVVVCPVCRTEEVRYLKV